MTVNPHIGEVLAVARTAAERTADLAASRQAHAEQIDAQRAAQRQLDPAGPDPYGSAQ